MADEIGNTDQQVGVFMSPTKSFVLPDKDTDIIMVGPEQVLPHLEHSWSNESLTAAKVGTGYFLEQSKRPSFITKIQSNLG